MIHHRFYVNVFIRVSFITLTSLVLAYVFFHRGDLYIAVNILLLLIIQVFLLLHYINRVNRDLAAFFGAVSSDDTTVAYKKSAKGRSFENLYEQFDQINRRIQMLRLENNRRSYYLQHLVDNAGIGILSYTGGGKIDILNPAANTPSETISIQENPKTEDMDKLQHNNS